MVPHLLPLLVFGLVATAANAASAAPVAPAAPATALRPMDVPSLRAPALSAWDLDANGRNPTLPIGGDADGNGTGFDPLEWLIIPGIGGNSDDGVIFGLVGTVTVREAGTTPFHWRVFAKSLAATKENQNGVWTFPIQEHLLRVEYRFPDSIGLELEAEVGYLEIANGGYFGIGAGSEAAPRNAPPGQRFQHRQQEFRVSLQSRWRVLIPGLEWVGGLRVRWVDHTVYRGSLLEEHLNTPGPERDLLIQVNEHPVLELLTGLIWDTRDSDVWTREGTYAELSVRAAPNPLVGESGGWGGLTLDTRVFWPVFDYALVLAGRFSADILFGDVPFHELSQRGGFYPIQMLAARQGIRGIPDGRFRGRAKILATAEIRSLPLIFDLLGARIRMGAGGFIDAGRAWATLGGTNRAGNGTSTADLDGSGHGIQVGVGGGPRILWGQSGVMRIDFAWSPRTDDRGFAQGFSIYGTVGESF